MSSKHFTKRQMSYCTYTKNSERKVLRCSPRFALISFARLQKFEYFPFVIITSVESTGSGARDDIVISDSENRIICDVFKAGPYNEARERRNDVIQTHSKQRNDKRFAEI